MTMPRIPRIAVYGLIALVLVWLGGCLIKGAQPGFTKWRLNRVIHQIEPWAATTNYSAGGWRQLVASARALQNANPSLVVEVLQSRLEGAARRPEELAAEQSKVFLLLRVLFDLPENGQPSEHFGFGGWPPGVTALNADRTVNLAWPVTWNQGKPRLVAGREGTAGRDYAAQNEYSFLRYKFKPRDLSTFRP